MITSRRARWLLAGLIAAFIATLWCAVLSPAPAIPHFFQVELETPVRITARVYYNRGADWRESESGRLTVDPTAGFTTIRLPLPPGKYRGLQFLPTDTLGSVKFRNARIVTFSGGTVRTFSPADFSASSNTTPSADKGGIVRAEATAQRDVPKFSITFNPVLRLAVGFWPKTSLFLSRWLGVFIPLLAALLLIPPLLRMRVARPLALREFCNRQPRTTLAALAVIVTVLSCYPVVFFGKSFVSPTNGALLLYDHSPTIPGFTDSRQDDVHAADVGAMMWQHLPYTVQQHHALRGGAVPLWNRYNSTGTPLLGQGQSMFGDPLHFLVIAAGGEAWAFDLKFLIVRALFACGIGWCVWALTRDFAASAIATLAAGFIAFFNYRVCHPSVFTVGYSPWILVAWVQLALAADRRAFRRNLVLWFIANWIVLTSGTVKEAYLLILTLNVTGFLVFLTTPGLYREKIKRTLFLAAAATAFVLVSSPCWWIFLHSLGSAYTAYDVPRVFQIRREWLIGLFDDLFYREFAPGQSVYQPATNFLILLGCFCAVLQPRRLLTHRGALVLLAGAVGAIGLAFQWGPPTWSPAWVLNVPLLRNVNQFHNVFSCVAVVHLAVLAGCGFSLARRPLEAGYSGRLALMIGGVLVVMFVPYFLIIPPEWTDGHTWHLGSDVPFHQRIVYLHLLLFPLALWALLRIASARLRGVALTGATTLAVLLTLTLLLARHGQHLPFTEPNSFFLTPGTRPNLFEKPPSIKFLQREVAKEPGRVIGTGDNFFPGFGGVYDLEGINGTDALINRRYREFAEAAGLPMGGSWRYRMAPADLPKWQPILDFLNVRYLLAPRDTLSEPTGYERVVRLDFDVYRSNQSWPRAFFTNRVERYDVIAELIDRIRENPTSTPFAAVQSTELLPRKVPTATPDAAVVVVPARDYVLEPNRTSFTVTNRGPGIVVLQEAWLADDFVVTLDGKPVPYLRVNHAFKGIAVTVPGTHRISFTYWPKNFTFPLILAGIGLVGFGFLSVAIGRNPTPDNQTA